MSLSRQKLNKDAEELYKQNKFTLYELNKIQLEINILERMVNP